MLKYISNFWIVKKKYFDIVYLVKLFLFNRFQVLILYFGEFYNLNLDNF